MVKFNRKLIFLVILILFSFNVLAFAQFNSKVFNLHPNNTMPRDVDFNGANFYVTNNNISDLSIYVYNITGNFTNKIMITNGSSGFLGSIWDLEFFGSYFLINGRSSYSDSAMSGGTVRIQTNGQTVGTSNHGVTSSGGSVCVINQASSSSDLLSLRSANNTMNYIIYSGAQTYLNTVSDISGSVAMSCSQNNINKYVAVADSIYQFYNISFDNLIGYYNTSEQNLGIINGIYVTNDSIYVLDSTNLSVFKYDLLNETYFPNSTSLVYNDSDTLYANYTVSSSFTTVISWFWDNIFVSIGNFFTKLFNPSDVGNHTLIASAYNETYGNTTQTWVVEVLRNNTKPIIDSISIIPTYTAPNNNVTIYCEVHDDANSTDLLDVEIEIRNGLLWEPLAVSYLSGNTTYSVLSANTYSTGDVLDVRCRATDGEDIPLTSDWFTIDSAITYELSQTTPEPPSTLEPKFGQYKLIIPVICSDSYDLESSRQRMSYELDISINGSNYTNIANSSGLVLYSYNIYDDAINTTYQFRCRGYDSIEYSNYSYTDYILKKNITVFQLVELYEERGLIAGKPKQFTIYADLSALSGYKVIYSYIDCDNDGIWDDFKTHDIDKIDQTYSCVFVEGLNKMTYGIVIEKTSGDWTGICTSLGSEVDKCKFEKTIPLIAK